MTVVSIAKIQVFALSNMLELSSLRILLCVVKIEVRNVGWKIEEHLDRRSESWRSRTTQIGLVIKSKLTHLPLAPINQRFSIWCKIVSIPRMEDISVTKLSAGKWLPILNY